MEPYVYEEARQKMIRTSRNLGIAALALAFIFSSLFYVVIGLTCLSVIFALLSRGKRAHIDRTARVGIAAGCIATVFSLTMLAQTVFRLFNDTDYRNTFIQTSEAMYGETYKDLYGIDITEALNNLLGGQSNE